MTASPSYDAPSAPPMGPQGDAFAPQSAPKVAVSWTGVLMAIGALVAAVGAFLPFEKIVLFDSGSVAGTFQFTGVGAKTVTGQSLSGLAPGNAGKIIMAMAVLGLVFAGLVLAKKGRIWVGIVATLTSAIAVVMGLASLAAPASDAKDLKAAGYTAHALVKGGSTIATVGAGVMLLGALLAIFIRSRRSA